jgi:diguanylate cyclase (GGDEF)-like protein
MVFFAVLVEAFDLIYIQRPHNYAIEAKSDEKDILRISSAFQSMADELSMLTYDNAVWDDTYQYMDNENPEFAKETFLRDTFVSLNINGIYIYDINSNLAWGESYNKDFTKLIIHPDFSQPSTFIKNNLLTTANLIADNEGKPLSLNGYINIEKELILFSATSIFHSNAKGDSNGTLLFWRYIDDKEISNLQKRAGITFTINGIGEKILEKTITEHSLRTPEGNIHASLPLFRDSGSIEFSYQAPERLFDVNWFNRSTIITLTSFSLILLILTLLTHFIIIRPILRAGERIRKIVEHNDRASRFSTNRKDELGSLFNLVDLLLANIASQEQELISHNVKLQHMSETDGLTQIANRRSFDLYMIKLLTTEEEGLPISLLVCDIDYFKKFNDCYGHTKGDNALQLVATSLQRKLHQETDFVARYGGEEFVIVLKNTNKGDSYSVAQNLLKSISNLKIQHEKSPISAVITLSIGIYSFEVPDRKYPQQNATFYFEKADKALYQAKNEGRNRAVHYVEKTLD